MASSLVLPMVEACLPYMDFLDLVTQVDYALQLYLRAFGLGCTAFLGLGPGLDSWCQRSPEDFDHWSFGSILCLRLASSRVEIDIRLSALFGNIFK